MTKYLSLVKRLASIVKNPGLTPCSLTKDVFPQDWHTQAERAGAGPRSPSLPPKLALEHGSMVPQSRQETEKVNGIWPHSSRQPLRQCGAEYQNSCMETLRDHCMKL